MAPDPRIAVCPGSYDPITNGHLDVIARASQLFDEVVVGVVNHPVRKGKTLFDTEERLGFITEATAHRWATSAPRPFDVLVVEFARRLGARAIVKGLRAISRLRVRDGDEPAQPPRGARRRHRSTSWPAPSTVSSARVASRSSRSSMASIEDLVPEAVARRLKEELSR